MLGFAFCGSFCSFRDCLVQFDALIDRGYDVIPIMSENAYSTDTRFYAASDFVKRVEEKAGRKTVHTIAEAEKFGKNRLDALIIAPCTGNTLAKMAAGITDTAVTMAAKAHLRCDGKLLIALASNDAMSQNLKNIASLITRKSVFLLPMRQDNPEEKPHSLVSDFTLIPKALDAMEKDIQLRPIFLQ